MKKFSTNSKSIIREIITIIILLVMVGISLLSDCSVVHIPNFFVLSIKDVENLFFTLFTVQASVSTVSIAIVSIINGLINEYTLGVSVSRFIMNLKPKLLKHNRLIVANLIICILNYFCLSHCLFNVCIALFVTSVIITVLMVKEVYIIFMGKNFVRKEIYEYVYENYDFEILNDLNIELTSAIETGNTLIIQEDFNAIKTIFECEAKKSNYQKTKIIEQLSTIVCDAFEKITHKHNGSKNNQCLLTICEIYKIANSAKEIPLHLDIWERIVHDFFTALKDMNYEQINENFVYYILHAELYKNLKGRKQEEIKNSSLRIYSSWGYSIIREENSKLTKDEQKIETKSIYDGMQGLLYYASEFDDESDIKELMTIELCYLHKVMIDVGDVEGLKRHYFDSIRYGLDKPEQPVIYVVTLIYLYYLSEREPLVKGKKIQENARKIIEEFRTCNEYFYYHLNINNIAQTKLSFVKKMIQNWEYFEESEAKTLITEDIVDDFFIFSVLSQSWQNSRISDMVDILVPDSMFSIYNRYFSKDDGESLKKLYSQFEKLFSNEKETKEHVERIALLNDVFNERYKSEIIDKGQSEKITEEQKLRFEESIKNKIKDIVDTELKPFVFKFKKEDEIINKENTLIYASILSNYFFQQDAIEKYIEKHLHTRVIVTFIRSILSNIDYIELSSKDKHKQKTLINAIGKLSLIPSVAIGNRENFWGDEEEQDLLKKYIANMRRIKYPDGYNCFFILDEKLIEFSMENIRVEIIDLPWEDIKRKCKDEDSDVIKFNVTNNIYLPFTKSEIEEYITNTEKKVLVYGDIKVRVADDKVGAGIEIVSK